MRKQRCDIDAIMKKAKAREMEVYENEKNKKEVPRIHDIIEKEKTVKQMIEAQNIKDSKTSIVPHNDSDDDFDDEKTDMVTDGNSYNTNVAGHTIDQFQFMQFNLLGKKHDTDLDENDDNASDDSNDNLSGTNHDTDSDENDDNAADDNNDVPHKPNFAREAHNRNELNNSRNINGMERSQHEHQRPGRPKFATISQKQENTGILQEDIKQNNMEEYVYDFTKSSKPEKIPCNQKAYKHKGINVTCEEWSPGKKKSCCDKNCKFVHNYKNNINTLTTRLETLESDLKQLTSEKSKSGVDKCSPK